jgi:hypothetical protein
MGLWRSIETAPKDGTFFLAICPMDDGGWWWIGPAVWIEDDCDKIGGPGAFCADNYPHEIVDSEAITISSSNCPEISPTHWMPMPDPPAGIYSAACDAIEQDIAIHAGEDAA